MKVIIPIYNTKGLKILEGLTEQITLNTTFMLVSGNVDKALDVAWVNQTAAILKERYPKSTLLAATAGLEHVRALTVNVTSPVEGVVYIYEPNFSNEPEFTWDFAATLDHFATVKRLAHANNLKAIGKPTGRPLYQAYLAKHGWDYAALGAEMDELFVQTQTYCKKGETVFSGAIGKLLGQYKKFGHPSPVSIQISVDPSSPNGVSAKDASACLQSIADYARKGELSGVMLWWSPRYPEEVTASLASLSTLQVS